jgi:hypothetical protein
VRWHAHPVRQRDLGGDVEACQDSNPGCSCNNTSRQCGRRIASHREQDHRHGCAERSDCHKTIGSESYFQPWQSERGTYASGIYFSHRIAKAAVERAAFVMIVVGDLPDSAPQGS